MGKTLLESFYESNFSEALIPRMCGFRCVLVMTELKFFSLLGYFLFLDLRSLFPASHLSFLLLVVLVASILNMNIWQKNLNVEVLQIKETNKHHNVGRLLV